MNRINAVAAIAAFFLFGASFLLTDQSAVLFNLLGLTVVVSGTVGAMFLSYPSADLLAAVRVARNSYTVPPPTPDEVVESLMDVAMRSRQGGMLALEAAEEQSTLAFLRSALGMLVDRDPEHSVRDILYTEMYFFQLRRAQHERVFHRMAQLAPSFGVAGSILGLIGMLAGIGDVDVVMQTIPIALTSTLYGVVLSNLFLTPVAENIRAKTHKEVLVQKIIVEGVVAIMQEENSQRLAKRLEAFMTPAARPGSERTFAEIRERYRKMQRELTAWASGARTPTDSAPLIMANVPARSSD